MSHWTQRRQRGGLWLPAVLTIVILGFGLLMLLGPIAGSGRLRSGRSGKLDLVWGRRGLSDGRMEKPRAIAVDSMDRVYIVDMTARIQVFSAEGRFLRAWQTPEFANGKPSGLTIDTDGNLLVADTHYFRILTYTPDGELLANKTIGGTQGHRPGQFGFVTDVVKDSRGNYYIAEYGEYDRIQKFAPDGTFLFQWGGHGSEPSQFVRPQNLAIDEQDQIWVADACNHRIQVFDARHEPVRLVRRWGQQGSQPGQLSYPYDLTLDGRGHVYVCEFGNSRVQKFTLDGTLVGSWGKIGRGPGELYNPWALALDRRGRLHVLDTYNHRVQRIRL